MSVWSSFNSFKDHVNMKAEAGATTQQAQGPGFYPQHGKKKSVMKVKYFYKHHDG
jgi:hypothetical protein